ncbi:hypothetical protein GP486_001031 [Trichoglossum hirsutum]|uniref:Protein kinase domain-containing protein n=1 Tax=Trichoglossum hirsutum TaxID=265104 RepID=A0A9P8LHG5_9PEZI|nr:hypothetical protein GP486_001031 [Trichoglossum hirsutum]
MCWREHRVSINFLQRIWLDLPPRLQTHFNIVLSMLNTKIEAATTLVDRATDRQNHKALTANVFGKSGKLHRGRFTFSVQGCLEKTIQDMASWQRDMLDPSWFQLLPVSNPTIDHVITRHTTTQSNSFAYLRSLRVRVREAVKGAVGDASRSRIIVDIVPYMPVADQKRTSDGVHHLAKLLSKIDPRVFCLPCTGVVKHLDEGGNISSFDFIFALPPDLRNPRSLRQVLLESDQRVSLNKRLDVAQQLAKTVMFIHSVKLVHKNIRPEVVLSFSGPQANFEQIFLGTKSYTVIPPVRGKARTRFHHATRHPQSRCTVAGNWPLVLLYIMDPQCRVY